MPKLRSIGFLEPCEFIYSAAVLIGARFWIKDQDTILVAHSLSILHVILVMASVWEASRVALVACIDLALTVAQWFLNMGWLQLPYVQSLTPDDHPVGYVKVAVLFGFLAFSIARLGASKCAGDELDEDDDFIQPRPRPMPRHRSEKHRTVYANLPQSVYDEETSRFSPRKPTGHQTTAVRYGD